MDKLINEIFHRHIISKEMSLKEASARLTIAIVYETGQLTKNLGCVQIKRMTYDNKTIQVLACKSKFSSDNNQLYIPISRKLYQAIKLFQTHFDMLDVKNCKDDTYRSRQNTTRQYFESKHEYLRTHLGHCMGHSNASHTRLYIKK